MTTTDPPLKISSQTPDELRRRYKERQAKKLDSTLTAVAPIAPDDFVRGEALAGSMHLPREAGLALVRHSKPGALAAMENKSKEIAETQPLLYDWLNKPDRAAVAHDDIPALRALDRTASGFVDVLAGSGEAGLRRQAVDGALALGFQGLLSPAEVEAAVLPHMAEIKAIRAGMPSYIHEREAAVQAAGDRLNAEVGTAGEQATALAQAIDSIGDLSSPDSTTRKVEKAMLAYSKGGFAAIKSIVAGRDEAAAFVEDPRYAAAQIVEQAPNAGLSVAGAALGSTLGPGGAVAGLFSGEFLSEYGGFLEEQASRRGLDLSQPGTVTALLSDPALVSDFNRRAGIKAGVTAFVDTAGTAVLGSKIAGAVTGRAFGQSKVPFAAKVADALAEIVAAAPAGAVVEGASEGLGYTAATGEVDIGAALREALVSPLSEGAQIATMASAQMAARGTKAAVVSSPEAVRSVVDAVRAQEDAATLTSTVEAMKASKAFKRAPERVQEILAAGAGKGKADTVYVARPAWDAAFSGEGLSPEQAAADTWKGGAAAYREAKASGTLAIPTADFAAKVGPTEHFDALIQDARMRPDGATLREAEEGLADLQSRMKAAGEAATTEAKVVLDQAKRVADLEAQILAAEEQAGGETLFQEDRALDGEGAVQPEPSLLGKVGKAVGDALGLTKQRPPPQVTPVTLEPTSAESERDARGLLTDAALQATFDREEQEADLTAQKLEAAYAVRRNTERSAQFRKSQAARKRASPATPQPSEKISALRTQLATERAKLGEMTTLPTGELETMRLGFEQALVGAGRSQREAVLGSTLLTRMLNVVAQRYGMPLAELATRFPIAVSRGTSRDAPAGGETLEQDGKPGKRGQVTFRRDGQALSSFIKMLENANESTFLHETGHVFLRIMGDLAADSAAPEQIRADYAGMLKWLGVESREAITDADEEKWARGFEAYLREGKAPTPEVRRMFAAFKAWLTDLYRDLTGLGDVALTDEVRAIMDRLVATDAEILVAEQERGDKAAFETQPVGMDDVAWVAYQQALQDRRDARREAMTRQLMADTERAKRALREQRIAKVRVDVAKVVADMPAVKALTQMLGQGDGPEFKLDTTSVLALFKSSSKVAKALQAAGVLTDKGGMPVEDAADAFGFEAADEFAREVASATDKERLIDRRAAAIVDAANPDSLSRPRVKKLARDAVQAADELAVERQELDVLNALVQAEGQGRREAMTPVVNKAIARKFAEGEIAAKRFTDIRPHSYRAAAQRENTTATKAVAAGKFQEAGIAKQQEIINRELAGAAQRAIDQAERDRAAVESIGTPGRQEAMGKGDPAWRNQTNRLRARFGLGTIRPDEYAESQPMAAWVASLDKAAQEPNASVIVPIIPAWLLDEAAYPKDSSELTPERLHELRLTVEQLYEVARDKHKALAGQRQETLLERAAGVALRILEWGPDQGREFQQRPGWLRTYGAEHTPIDRYVRELDGGPGGPLFEAWLRLRNEGEAAKSEMRKESNRALKAAFKKIPLKERAAWGHHRTIPGVSRKLSRENVLLIALYEGSESGREINRRPGGFTEAEIAAALRTLAPADAEWLNAVWEHQSSRWPQSKALIERVWGVAPPKIEARPFEVINAQGERLQLDGGYTRVKYHGDSSNEITLQEVAARVGQGAAVRPTIRMGQRYERVENPRIARYDFGVVLEGLGETIQALAFVERLHDMNAVLTHPDVRAAMISKRGEEVYNQFKDAFTSIAVGRLSAQSAGEQVAAYLRAGTVVSKLGLKVSTNLVNQTGILSSAEIVGPEVLLEYARLVTNPFALKDAVTRMWAESSTMRSRADTFNREQADVREQLNTRFDTSVWESVPMFPMAFGQIVVDTPTYWVAKGKALAAGADEATAIAIAEQAIKDSQSSGLAADLPKFMRDHKYWSLFMGYVNRQLNNVAARANLTDFRKPGDVARLGLTLAYTFILPSAFMLAYNRFARGDDDRDPFWLSTLWESALSAMGGLGFVREAAGALRVGSGYSGPADFSAIAALGDVVEASRDDHLNRKDAEAWATLAGILTRLPTAQGVESWRGFDAYMRGRAEWWSVITGPPRRRRR